MARLDSGISSVRAPAADFAVGDLRLTLTESGLGAIIWRGVEMLRGATYPIRDADWGTAPAINLSEIAETTSDGRRLRREFSAWDGAVTGSFEVEASNAGHLTLRVALEAKRQIRICRAGFTLLHPIVGLAGEPLAITHPDGVEESTRFPRTISPSQPARDICGLRYSIDGCTIAIAFSGDTFEMEDQRNWSDASYKTYCRPLSLPHPYLVEAGETIEQTITITLAGQPRRTAGGRSTPVTTIPAAPTGEKVPVPALALERGWEAPLPAGIAAMPLLTRLDLNEEDAVALPDGLRSPLDLELITADDLDSARDQLARLAGALAAGGLTAGHVTALPRAYLKSHQPDAVWPSGPGPAELIAAAREAFPNARIGGGMLTNFTEFNRCRPDPATVDFVTHGTSAIVHAADDNSVFQTIETLPHIFESARTIAPGSAYRLGLVSIGMRTNPYGEGLVDNPDGMRRTMTAHDPRAGTRAGAAWLVAAMGATRGFGIEQIALAAPAGPFGLSTGTSGLVTPAYHVVREFHAMAGLPRTDVAVPGSPLAVVAARQGNIIRAVVANVRAEAAELDVGDAAQVALLDETTEAAAVDPDWIAGAKAPRAGIMQLSGYAIAFVTLATDGGDGA